MDGKRLGLIIDGVDIFERWGINVKERDIGKPNKKKGGLDSVAHSSIVYDFSELYGGASYEERVLRYTLNIIGPNKTRTSTQFLETEFNNFIFSKSQFRLIDEVFPGYYFLAEVRRGTDFSPILTVGELSVTFDCYAFKIKEAREGSPYWDDYTILDRYQETKFKIEESQTIQLYNDGSNYVVPTVVTSSDFQVTLNGVTYPFSEGSTKNDIFTLSEGLNILTVTGNGTIEFRFHKELI